MQKEIIYQHKKITYKLFGKGKPVILIHGFGEDNSIWRNQVNFLQDKFRLIIPDLPGSGKSDMIEDMSMEGMADVIWEILKIEAPPTSTNEEPKEIDYKHEVGKKKTNDSITSESFKSPPMGGWGASLLGHSMGGYIGLAFAEKFPELLNSLGLIHSTAFPDSDEKIEIRKKGIEFIKKYGASEFIKTTTPNLFSENTQNNNPELIAEQIQLSTYFSDKAIIQYYEQMIARPDRTLVLKNANFPILFMAGEHDKAVPLSDILKQSHLPDISYFHVLSNAAHMGMLEETDKHNRILERFLSRTDD